ncbi:hypothetical protein HaLaN_15773, partial [Haematococcus lacustris]
VVVGSRHVGAGWDVRSQHCRVRRIYPHPELRPGRVYRERFRAQSLALACMAAATARRASSLTKASKRLGHRARRLAATA